jgi:hypothetical protein
MEQNDNINLELRAKILQRVWNEYRYSKSELEQILQKSDLDTTKIRLMVALIKSCSWYQLRAILSPAELEDALSETVLSQLWPASIQDRYRYAATVLRKHSLSSTR